MNEAVIAYIVDDDPEASRSLAAMLGAKGFETIAFSTGEEWLAFEPRLVRSVVVLDLNLGAGIGGLEVLKRLGERDVMPPVVVISAYGTIPTAVDSIRLGAATFLEKPFQADALLKAVSAALFGFEDRVAILSEIVDTERRLRQLGDRERLILKLVCEGYPTKWIANHLVLGMRTIEACRSAIVKHFDVGTWQEVIGRVNRYLGHRCLPLSAIYPGVNPKAGPEETGPPDEPGPS
ncbi:MAG TPA: response regulator [Pirellulaceae bacterium]|nr:response regulator [Pirellulaceae bacterium]